MHLTELIHSLKNVPTQSVPGWMVGCFKRKSISFANGQTDMQTHVFWLQGRNLTIDLRLPIDDQLVTKDSWQKCSQAELMTLANYEGWYANSDWLDGQLSWRGGVSFQLHNRWPEPAILSRVGDCMMEFSPQNTYVEDWRMQSISAGPLVSLALIEEVNLSTGVLRHKGGALIINGDYAGLVLGRNTEINLEDKATQLRDKMTQEKDNHEFLEALFNFETSVATGNMNDGFTVCYSTKPARVKEKLLNLEGFEFDKEKNEIIQTFAEDDQVISRRFTIDALEAVFAYSAKTPWQEDAKQWFDFEQDTLGRYLEPKVG